MLFWSLVYVEKTAGMDPCHCDLNRIWDTDRGGFDQKENVRMEEVTEKPDQNSLYAKAAVLMDADSGRILYEKNGHQAMANASTTKILTCIIALENCDLDSEVTVSTLAASQPKVHLGMREGQKFYLKDLLYGLMLESYNDCAVAIAEHIAGTTGDLQNL